MNASTMRRGAILGLLVLATATASFPAANVRVKDVAHLEGVRDNQLVGYGLVVGLQGTGDSNKSRFTVLSVVSMLEKLGVRLDSRELNTKNMAAVIVTANLPPFASNGQRLDITVSSIGDAENLAGGILLQAPLLGADGKVYAVSQGSVSLGGNAGAGLGAAAQQAGGSSQHKTTGRIPNGAIVEREVKSDMISPDGSLTWVLRKPDFATATNMVDAINASFDPDIAKAESAERVKVFLPGSVRSNPVPFIASIEDILMKPDAPARVIVNERTGTIVFGENARISFVAVSHGSLSVTIKAEEAPNAGASGGQAAATVQIDEGKENTLFLPDAGTVRELVRALNSIGATPRDIIAVLQAISEAGALHAELVFL